MKSSQKSLGYAVRDVETVSNYLFGVIVSLDAPVHRETFLTQAIERVSKKYSGNVAGLCKAALDRLVVHEQLQLVNDILSVSTPAKPSSSPRSSRQAPIPAPIPTPSNRKRTAPAPAPTPAPNAGRSDLRRSAPQSQQQEMKSLPGVNRRNSTWVLSQEGAAATRRWFETCFYFCSACLLWEKKEEPRFGDDFCQDHALLGSEYRDWSENWSTDPNACSNCLLRHDGACIASGIIKPMLFILSKSKEVTAVCSSLGRTKGQGSRTFFSGKSKSSDVGFGTTMNAPFVAAYLLDRVILPARSLTPS
ncbi:hypothetical protein TWF730_000007 [Orbilia blumenaviensis]|uniref:Uncharacterized protein n=1 Tax=Orbilia blumenaviensis TaxID=1796055 RepID=A0AAV9VRF3_9PEZI